MLNYLKFESLFEIKYRVSIYEYILYKPTVCKKRYHFKNTSYLHLYTLAINKFATRYNTIKDQGALLARIHHNRVQFSINYQRRVFTFEHIHNIVHFDILDFECWVIFLVFLKLIIFLYKYMSTYLHIYIVCFKYYSKYE